MEYHAINWEDKNTATRRTREVDLKCEIIEGGMFYKEDGMSGQNGWTIILRGTADHEHHLVEDAAILLKKMAEVKCGGGH